MEYSHYYESDPSVDQTVCEKPDYYCGDYWKNEADYCLEDEYDDYAYDYEYCEDYQFAGGKCGKNTLHFEPLPWRVRLYCFIVLLCPWISPAGLVRSLVQSSMALSTFPA